MHKHSHKPALFKAHVVLPTVKTIPILSRQQWSAKQRLRDSIDIEHCSMDDWVAFTVTVDGWFNGGPMLGKKAQKEKAYFVCFVCRHLCVCISACVNEKPLRGDSRYLRPADRHLACCQPSTTCPYGMLRNVTSWHCQ